MYTVHALVHQNIDRARHWLPFIDPMLRDLVSLIPALFCEGHPAVGTYGHTTCSRAEYDLLKKYLKRRPEVTIGRLPDRIGIESLILLVRPSISNEFHSCLMLVCRTRTGHFADEIRKKAQDIRKVFHDYGITLSFLIQNDTLPQLLIYEIMRTGIVLAGMHPTTRRNASSDSRIYVGELPRLITDATGPQHDDWNPFQCYLDQEVAQFIEASDYPSPQSIPGAHPFIIPYLHILHRYDETMDAEGVAKIRASLSHLFSPFPPTHEAMKELKKAWKIKDSYQRLDQMSFENAMQLRKWLLPLEKTELPVFSWPPQRHMALPAAKLCQDKDLWYIRQAEHFRHPYPWAVLIWGTIAGLISSETKLCLPHSLGFKNNTKQRLVKAFEAIVHGADIIVPQDHTQGSIRKVKGRFFFSDEAFAIMEKGNKYSLEIFEEIKKKALLDDIDL